jgi:hypothetical protein
VASQNAFYVWAATHTATEYYSALGGGYWNKQGGSGTGSTTLADLTDVDITSPSGGQILTYNAISAKWVNSASAGSLSALSDVSMSSPVSGQFLMYGANASNKWGNTNRLSYASGIMTFNASSYVFSGGDVSQVHDLSITGDLNLASGSIQTSGNIVSNSQIWSKGNFTVGASVFTVDHSTGDTNISGAVLVDNAITVNSTTTLKGNLYVKNGTTTKFSVQKTTGDFYTEGSGAIIGGLVIDGSTTLNDTSLLTGSFELQSGTTMVWGGGTLDATTGAFTTFGSILAVSNSYGIGYGAGAGADVTQGTNKTTGVAINAMCGQITTANSSLASGAKATFTVNNTSCGDTDLVIVNVVGGGTSKSYAAYISAVNLNAFDITLENISGGALAEAVVIGFAIIKGVIV